MEENIFLEKTENMMKLKSENRLRNLLTIPPLERKEEDIIEISKLIEVF